MNNEWIEGDLLEDTIENLEMLQFMLDSTYDVAAKWKWIVVATYQALYGFAICSIRGTNDFQVIEPNERFNKYWAKYDRLTERSRTTNRSDEDLKQLRHDLRAFLNELRNGNAEISFDDLYQEAKSADYNRIDRLLSDLYRRLRDAHLEYTSNGNLIGIHEALRRAQPANLFWRQKEDRRNMWRKAYAVSDVPLGADIEARERDYWHLHTHSQPLITTPEQDRAIERSVSEFRNGFVHRRPGIWAIEVEALIECVRNVLPVIRFLAFESNNILYHPEEQRSRTENAMATVEKRFATMPKIKKENDVVQVAEQGIEYASEQDTLVDEGANESVTAKDQLRILLRKDGLLAEPASLDDIQPPISESRREELAHLFSTGKPLSQIIIEDRD